MPWTERLRDFTEDRADDLAEDRAVLATELCLLLTPLRTLDTSLLADEPEYCDSGGVMFA